MRRLFALTVLAGLVALSGMPAAFAASDSAVTSRRHKLNIPQRRPAMQRFVNGKRIGGYSYSWSDTIGSTGSAGQYARDPSYGSQQTIAGPFDNGFFFNSSHRPHGDDSPYWN